MTGIFNLAWLIILFPAVGVIFNSLFSTRFREEVASTVAILASALSFVVSLLVVIALLGLPPDQRVVHVPGYNFLTIINLKIDFGLWIDTLSATMLMVVTFVGTLIHIYSVGYMHGDSMYRRFFVYLNLFMTSMLILVLGNSYLMMFIGWEGVGLCSYLLIGFWFEKWSNTEAANKAFIVNRIGDYGFLMAMFAMFAFIGSLQFTDVFSAAAGGKVAGGVATAITLLLFLGATGKSAQIPLYVWLPDAMAGPTPVSALIHAATMVTAGVYMIARSQALYTLAPLSQAVVAIVGAVTALFAATIAVGQFDIKKVLAYSTVSQLGFMIAAVGMGATVAGIFHLGMHAFFKALLFLAAGSVIHAMEHAHHEAEHAPAHGIKTAGQQSEEAAVGPGDRKAVPFDPNDMRLMGGLRNRMPLTFWTYLIGAAALSGVPPLSGFWSKDEILAEASLKGAQAWPYELAFWLLVIAAFFTAFYMTRQVLMVFFGRPRDAAAEHAPESPPVMTYVLAVLAFFAFFAGFINLPGAFSHWLAPEEAFAGLNPVVAIGSTAVALLGIGLGYLMYRPRPLPRGVDDPLRVMPVLGWIFTNLWNPKYWVDQIYNTLFVNPYNMFARFLAFTVDGAWFHDWFHDVLLAGTFKAVARFLSRPIETGVIDAAVNGIGRMFSWLSAQLRQVQTGYVRNYALSVLLGVAIIVAYFVLR